MKPRCAVIILVFSGLLAASAAWSVQRDGNVITMNDAESKLCDSGGGRCLLVNESGVEREIQKRVRQALETCRSYTKDRT